MVTIDVNPDPEDTEEDETNDLNYRKAFEENGITYLEVYEVCYSSSEIPDWIYEVFPHIDHISHAEITLSENLEQLWIHEFEWEEERDIHVALFIPESLKEADDRYGSESLERDGLDVIAETLAPLVEERADRPPIGTEKPPRERLNHLINKANH
ncbi:hypothetical protein [Halalkaliarchaeum desulfuricum]|uniref:hypothetical protein n=1 Tax=Halalkaliarchaeum desulfuricum TaxID=2055893 RepID=UPI00105AB09F|nr:hypothetical protein [Halalkaliarchaeum desulfuricum]